jgi:hypothetical protein
VLSARAYTALIYIFLILAVTSFGLAFYSYQKDLSGQAIPSDGSNVNVDYKTEIANFNTMILNLDIQISQLQSINSPSRNMVSQITQAQLAAQSLSAQIAQLEGERLRLQSIIGRSQEASLVGSFFYTYSRSYYSILDGVYVNTGLTVARLANVTFTFYSQPNGRGTVLCSITYQLGDVAGQAVSILGRIVCGTGTTNVGSVTFQFKWS